MPCTTEEFRAVLAAALPSVAVGSVASCQLWQWLFFVVHCPLTKGGNLGCCPSYLPPSCVKLLTIVLCLCFGLRRRQKGRVQEGNFFAFIIKTWYPSFWRTYIEKSSNIILTYINVINKTDHCVGTLSCWTLCVLSPIYIFCICSFTQPHGPMDSLCIDYL